MFEIVQTVYSMLEDEKSRIVFKSRLLAIITNDVSHITEMPGVSDLQKCKKGQGLPNLSKIKEQVDENESVIIYGAGLHGAIVYNFCKANNIKALCFLDKSTQKQRDGFLAQNVLPPGDAHMKKIIITSRTYESEIIAELNWHGIDKKNIICLEYDNLYYDTDKQYFDTDIINFSEHEVFVDGGMYIGDTAEAFFKKVNGNYVHYYGFEPDRRNFARACDLLNHKANVTVTEKGLYSCETRLGFVRDMTMSKIDEENGDNHIYVTSIDAFFSDKSHIPTFIKMDIEGAELEALRGAKDIICKHKPKLAICVYHKPEDFIKIPLYIKTLVPEYKLYMRHYTNSYHESVVYAVI